MPDTESGTRDHSERGRRERARRDRRLQWAVVVIAVVTGVIAGSLGSSPNHTARASAGTTPTTAHLPREPVQAGTLLFAHLNASDRLDLLAVAGVAYGGRVGSVVFVPPTTLVEVPSFETQSLVDVPRLGGASLLATVVANALGLDFDQVIVVDDAQLAQLVAPAKQLRVTFQQSVQVEDAAGTLAFTPGRATISSTDATRLLIGPSSGGALEHLVTLQAVLEGWFARLRDVAVAQATERHPGIGTLINLARSDVNFDTLPVDVLSTGSVTRYDIQEPQAAALIRADLPDGLITAGPRPRVELLNGTGAISLTQAVARRVVPAGGEITLTGNVPGFGVKHTSVVYYRPTDEPAARRLVAALGVGSVAVGNVPLDVVDLTVVIGADFHPNRT